MEKITHHVLIVAEANYQVAGLGTTTRAIRVPMDFFDDTEIIQRTILLTENLMDTEFYQIVGRVYATLTARHLRTVAKLMKCLKLTSKNTRAII